MTPHLENEPASLWGDTKRNAGEATAPKVLLVAVTDPASPALTEAVRARAGVGPARFHLLVPDPSEHAELTESQRRDSHARGRRLLESSLPVLSEAAGTEIGGSVSLRHDPMDAIEELLRDEPADEIILLTSHHRISEGLHLDLPRRVGHLGLVVETVFDSGK